MEINKIIVGILSLFGIAFVYWFFLMKKEEAATVAKDNFIEIVVKGGYVPNIISVPKDIQTTISFVREDPSSCLEEVVLPEFKIRTYLPLHKSTKIQITPKKSGTYEISCGMNMFHGKIIVN